MNSPTGAGARRRALLLAEPTVHFLVIGALLFVGHRLVAGDPRAVAITPGLKAELARRFRDSHDGRAPSAQELAGELRGWERDEALYREALRDRLDRNDGTIRTVLADRVRARVALAVPKREPTDADLDRWLATHRSLYEVPRRYDFGTVAFPKARPSSPAELERYQRLLREGADPGTLGRPIVGGNLTAADLERRFGPALAARIQGLPVGQWQRLDDDQNLLLVRVSSVEGGLPSADQLRARLAADWSYAERTRAIDQAVQAIVDRYHFQERP